MPPIQTYIREVALVTKIHADILRSKCRVRWVFYQRAAMMFVIRKKTGLSYPDIGRRFSSGSAAFDHSTVINACQKVERELRARHPDMLRCYKIAIRAWVKLQRVEDQRRFEAAATIERIEHAHPGGFQRPRNHRGPDRAPRKLAGVRAAAV